MLDLIEYQDLQIGETRTGECPSCGRRKFYVTRKPAGLAYICFRASCHTQGFVGSDSAALPMSRPASKKKAFGKPYTGKLFDLQDDDIDYFYDRFKIDTFGMVKIAHHHRYAFRILSPIGKHRGWVLRAPNWGGEPKCWRNDKEFTGSKSLNYYEYDADGRLAWYVGDGDYLTVCIVEDPVSALRIMDATRCTAVAMLGTHMTQDSVNEIRAFNPDKVILAYDNDAFGKSLDFASKYGGLLNIRTAYMEKDPKDYEDNYSLCRDLGVEYGGY